MLFMLVSQTLFLSTLKYSWTIKLRILTISLKGISFLCFFLNSEDKLLLASPMTESCRTKISVVSSSSNKPFFAFIKQLLILLLAFRICFKIFHLFPYIFSALFNTSLRKNSLIASGVSKSIFF